jgi:hypothetical protein
MKTLTYRAILLREQSFCLSKLSSPGGCGYRLDTDDLWISCYVLHPPCPQLAGLRKIQMFYCTFCENCSLTELLKYGDGTCIKTGQDNPLGWFTGSVDSLAKLGFELWHTDSYAPPYSTYVYYS